MAFILFLVNFLLCTSSVKATEVTEEILSAFVAVIDQVHQEDCTIVLIFDELMPSDLLASRLISRLKNGTRAFLVLDITQPTLKELYQKYNVSNKEFLIEQYLFTLYRLGRCYTFIIWLTDLNLLYPPNYNLHPGYRFFDVVIFTAHHLTTNENKSLIGKRFWKEIPNALGLRKVRRRKSSIEIFTVLPYFLRAQTKSHVLDSWDVDKKRFEKNATLLFNKFTTFNSAGLGIGVIWKEPFFISGNQKRPYLDGLDWRLLGLVKQKLDYTWTSGSGAGNGFTNTGGNLVNGSWTGIMGLIEKGIIDIGVGGNSVTPGRLKDFGYCKTYYTDSYIFISPITVSSNIWNNLVQFTRPLSYEVWTVLFCCTIVLAFIMKAFATFEMKTKKKAGMLFLDHWFTSASHNLLHLINIFCQKSFAHMPKSGSLMLAYSGTSISITILGIAFGGCLFSQLLAKTPEKYIDSVTEVISSGLQVDIRQYGGHMNTYVLESNNLQLQLIWEKAKFVNYSESFGSMEEVVKGNRIFIDSGSRLYFMARYKYMGTLGFKFHFGSENIIKFVSIGWPTRKNWPFKPKLDQIISQAVESGLVHYWMEHFRHGDFGWDGEAFLFTAAEHLPPQPEKIVDDPSEFENSSTQVKALKLEQLVGIFCLGAFGLGLAVVVFFTEISRGVVKWQTQILKRKQKNVNIDLMYLRKDPLILEPSVEYKLKRNVDIVWSDFINSKIIVSPNQGVGGKWK